MNYPTVIHKFSLSYKFVVQVIHKTLFYPVYIAIDAPLKIEYNIYMI